MSKNHILFGILIGLIIPFIGWAVLDMLNDALHNMNWRTKANKSFQFSEQLLVLCAICLNLLPFHWFRAQRFDNSMRGVIFPTVILAFTWAIYYNVFNF